MEKSAPVSAPNQFSKLPRWAGCLLAAVISAGVVWLRVLLNPSFTDRPMLILFFLPVIFCAYAFGLAAGLTATLTAGLGSLYFILPPENSFKIARSVDVLQLLIFGVGGAMTSVLTGHLHQATQTTLDTPRAGRLLSVERKVRRSFAIALSCLGAIALIAYLSIVQQNDAMERVLHTHEVIRTMDELSASMTSAQNAQRGYTIQGDEYMVAFYREAAEKVHAAMRRLRRLTSDNPAQRQRMEDLEPLVTARMKAAYEVIEIRRSQGFDAAKGSPPAQDGYRMQLEINERLGAMEKEEQAQLGVRQARADRNSLWVKAALILGGVLAFGFVSAALYAIGRDFAGSRQAEAALRKARGDLELRVTERTMELQAANEALQENKARLLTVTDTAQVGLVIVDREHRYRYANPAYCQILRLSPEELVGKPVAEILAPVYEMQVRARLDLAFQGQAVTYELRRPALTPGDEDRYYSVSYQPSTEHTEPVVVVVIVDITERRLAEEKLRFHEALLRETGHIAKVGGWDFDVETGEGYWTEEVAEIHDLGSSVATSKDFGLSFYHGESRARMEAAVKAAVENGIPYDLELELTTAKGNRKWVRTIGHPVVEVGRVTRVHGSFQDITARKRAEEALRASEVQLRLFIEQAPASMAMLDRKMNYLTASARWVREYGRGHIRLAGVNYYDVHPDVPDRWRKLHDRALAGEPITCEEDYWVQEDGSEHWLRWAVNPWIDARGEVGGVMILSEDITARKRAEDKLTTNEAHSQALLRLSQKLESADSYEDVLQASQVAVREMLGFRTVWFTLLSEDGMALRRVVTCDENGPRRHADDGMDYIIKGDVMLEQIVASNGLVVVDDARTDRRTNKEIVQRLGSRTIVNMPISLAGKKLGAIGTGTFGNEGVRILMPVQRAFFASLASQVATVLDRVLAMEQRARAEQKLADERNVLRTLIDSMPDVIFTKDLEGRFGISNPAHLRLLGAATEADVAGKTVFDFYSSDLAKAYHQDDLRVLTTGRPIFNREERCVNHEGQGRWHLTIKVPLRNQANELVGLIGMSRDVTERRLAEEMRERQRRRTALLAEVSRRLVLSDAPETLLAELFTDVAEELAVEYFMHYTVAEGPALIMRESSGLDARELERLTPLGFGEGLPGWVADQCERLILTNVQASNWNNATVERGLGFTVFAGHPLVAAGRLIGILAFASKKRARFEDDEIRLMASIANQIATALERRRLASELSASEARFRELADSLPQLAWTCGADGECDYLNRQWVEYTGRSEKEQMGQGWASAVHPADQEAALAEWVAAVKSGQPLETQFRLRRHDGAQRWFQVRAVPFHDEHGRVIKWFGSNTDIEDLKQAEEALRDREQRLHLILNQLQAIIWTTDRDLRITSAAGAALRTLELEAGSLVGRRLHELLSDIGEAGAASEAHQLALHGEMGNYQSTYQGRSFRACAAPFRNAAGEIVGVVGLAIDVTEQIRAEAAVREGETFNREVLDSLTAHIAVLDHEGHVIIVNEAWRQFSKRHFRGEAEEILGGNYLGVCDRVCGQGEPAMGAVAQGIRAVMAGERSYFGMEYPCHAEDEQRWFQLHVCPLSARTSAVVTAHEDITSRKLAENEVRDLNASLEKRVVERTAEWQAANKELESFSYSVSHDLRAPLRAVDGFSQAVMEDYGSQLPPEGVRYLQTIREGAQRMGQLIDDLLTFSRLSRTELNKRSIDTRALVDAALDELQSMKEGRDVEIHIGELATSYGDPSLLKQVWINLISNALKYSRKRSRAVIEIGSLEDDGQQGFFIRDNGSGFDMRYTHKLFGVFQRLHRADEFEGTGVGLAIVQRVVHRHGGRVWAESTLDAGATFRFTLKGGPN